MYREDKSSELAQKVADYLEDRSYGDVAAVVTDDPSGDVVATFNGVDFPIVTLVYDEQCAPRLHCELTLSIFNPTYPTNDYIECLNGYTLVDDIWYEYEEDDFGPLLIKLMVDNYNAHGPEDIAELACVNFIPIMKMVAA